MNGLMVSLIDYMHSMDAVCLGCEISQCTNKHIQFNSIHNSRASSIHFILHTHTHTHIYIYIYIYIYIHIHETLFIIILQ
jgi:hypothetical protein